MRIDSRLERQGLTTRQLFFIECWANLCHRDSIDSDRVSFNNIVNSLNEFDFLFKMGNKFSADKKRERAATELLNILKTDKCLAAPPFEDTVENIINLFNPYNIIKDPTKSPVEQKQNLFKSLCSELRVKVNDHYITKSIEAIESEVVKLAEPIDDELSYLLSLINNLMSVMLSNGIPLTECFLLYNNILMRSDKGGFKERFDSWKSKLIQPNSDYEVRFKLENEELYNLLIGDAPEQSFNDCLFAPRERDNGKKFITAKIVTSGTSMFCARNKAEQKLMDALDVIAYMVGKNNIKIQKQFKIQSLAPESQPVYLNNSDYEISANTDRLTKTEFIHFVRSMDGLFKKASPEAKKKISSVFGFLRNGINNTSKESRFTSCWSALESLTLGVSQHEIKHDAHVILSVIPCVGLDYVVKQLFALRGIIQYLKISPLLKDDVNYDLCNMNLGELYKSLKNDDVRNYLLIKFSAYPYALFSLKKMINLCGSPKLMGEKIDAHVEKVTLHIHRLYMVRNSIVHNAESNPLISLLTANLEHYLRATINAMYYTAAHIPSVTSPEEIFTRCNYMFKNIQNSLLPPAVKGKVTPIANDEGLIKWLELHQ